MNTDSERAGQPSLLDEMVAAIIAGAVYKVRGEVLRHLSTDRDGTHNVIHEHPKYQVWDRKAFRSTAWVRERLAWLALRRPSVLLKFLRRVAPARAAGLDAPGLVAHLDAVEPTVMRHARIDLRQVDLAEVLAAGLWAGAEFTICNSGGGETWKRCGKLVYWSSYDRGPDGDEAHSREGLRQQFTGWGKHVDGFIAPSSSFALALDKSLRALGATTLRAYAAAIDSDAGASPPQQ